MLCLETLQPRFLLSSAALQSDGTLRIFINDPEATIGLSRGKLRVFVQGYSLDYADPVNPDAQYHNYYTTVAKRYDLASVKRLDITTTASGATSDFDGTWGTEPFFFNSTSLLCKYAGDSIFTDFQFGSGDDDVTNYAVGNNHKHLGRFIYDYRANTSPVTHIDFTRIGGSDVIGVKPLPITIYGSPFADSFPDGNTSSDFTIYAGAGNDTITTGSGNDLIYGDGGDDVLYGGGGADSIYGGSGNDTLSGDNGNDFLAGEDGNDRLYGGTCNDRIYGGAGRDTLIGEAGNDRLNGQSGSDLYYANDGEADVLTDVLSGTNRARSDDLDRLINVTRLV